MKHTIAAASLLLLLPVACTKPAPAPPPSTPPAAQKPKTPPARPALPIPAPPDVAAPPADATKLTDGVAYKILTPGTGTEHPTDEDVVAANYTGWTTDGKAFDSTSMRGLPNIFRVTGVIPGWTEMLKLMTEGEKVRVWIPEALAYKGQAGRPAGMLVFDMEVVFFMKHAPAGTPPEAPADVAAPPKDAEKTASGLAYKVLKKGTGTEKPTASNAVLVDYTGWTTDGKSFDSSMRRGQPAIFPVGQVIPGWTEGLQLMTVGEKARFWIPEALAYKGQKGPPAGTLVFDVDLYKILPGPPPRPQMHPPMMGGQPPTVPGMHPGMPMGHPPIPGAPGQMHPMPPPSPAAPK